MRNTIIAANWKMHKNIHEAQKFMLEFTDIKKTISSSAKIIFFPPYIHLAHFKEYTHSTDIEFGAQNLNQHEKGAFTGEISAAMIQSCGAQYVLIGHSERRQYFHEDNPLLAGKINTALKQELKCMYCCGEKLEQRQENKQFDIVEKQIREALFHLNPSEMAEISIAYEPVWAIGTGLNASPEEAQEMHSFIRELIQKNYGSKVAENISIVYGGSLKAANAQEIFAQADIDGGLVGGASLNVADFLEIVKSI
jgi:triosephosphate isomerase (TIM)